MNGNDDPPPPEALIVTEPVPLVGDIVTLVPAIIWVTPPPPPATAKANEAVPKSDPVIPADTLSDPVMLEFPSEKKPFFILNSFGISFPCPRVC